MWILDVMPVVLVFLVLYFLVIRPSLEAPRHRWTFRYRDHTIEVRNFWFREVVSVDGSDQQATRKNGSLTHAEHRVVLPDGTVLRVTLSSGLSSGIVCRADDGTTTVFASDQPLSSAAPVVQQPSVTRDEDPRVGAARVLLADIGAVDAEASAVLELALRRMVAAEQAARGAAEAHAVLGGSTDDTSAVVADRAAAVEALLSSLRALHLRVASAPDDSDELLAGVRDVAARVAAATEVAAVRQRDVARRAGRVRQSS